MLKCIMEVTGIPVRFESITDAYERRRLEAAGEPAAVIDYHLSIYAAVRRGDLRPAPSHLRAVGTRER